eukprot:Opistho-2@20120
MWTRESRGCSGGHPTARRSITRTSHSCDHAQTRPMSSATGCASRGLLTSPERDSVRLHHMSIPYLSSPMSSVGGGAAMSACIDRVRSAFCSAMPVDGNGGRGGCRDRIAAAPHLDTRNCRSDGTTSMNCVQRCARNTDARSCLLFLVNSATSHAVEGGAHDRRHNASVGRLPLACKAGDRTRRNGLGAASRATLPSLDQMPCRRLGIPLDNTRDAHHRVRRQLIQGVGDDIFARDRLRRRGEHRAVGCSEGVERTAALAPRPRLALDKVGIRPRGYPEQDSLQPQPSSAHEKHLVAVLPRGRGARRIAGRHRPQILQQIFHVPHPSCSDTVERRALHSKFLAIERADVLSTHIASAAQYRGNEGVKPHEHACSHQFDNSGVCVALAQPRIGRGRPRQRNCQLHKHQRLHLQVVHLVRRQRSRGAWACDSEALPRQCGRHARKTSPKGISVTRCFGRAGCPRRRVYSLGNVRQLFCNNPLQFVDCVCAHFTPDLLGEVFCDEIAKVPPHRRGGSLRPQRHIWHGHIRVHSRHPQLQTELLVRQPYSVRRVRQLRWKRVCEPSLCRWRLWDTEIGRSLCMCAYVYVCMYIYMSV